MNKTIITVPVIKPTPETDLRVVIYDLARHTEGEIVAYVRHRNAYKMELQLQDADRLPNGSYRYELQDVGTDEIIGTGLLVVGDSTADSPTAYENNIENHFYEQ